MNRSFVCSRASLHGSPIELRSLGPACPACICVAGPLDALTSGGLGVVGSRDVDENGAATALAAAERAVELGIQIVSGLARNVDQTAMAVALGAGEHVVARLRHQSARS